MNKYRIIIIFLLIFISSKLFSDNVEKKLAKESFVIYEDFEVLKAQNRDKLIELYPSVYHAPELSEVDFKTYLYWYTGVPNAFLEFRVNTDEEMKHKRLGNFYLAWNYSGETLSIFCFPYYMTVRNVTVKNNQIIFSLIGIVQKSDLYYSNFIKTEIPFKEYEYDIHSAKIIIDGDYLDFYIDDVFIHTFCRINEATLKEYENLIKNNTCDLSKVTWPRHADGTSDYDDKIIMPESLIITGSTNPDKSTVGKNNVQTNIGESEKIKKVQVKSKDQIMAVKIPAVLRADPSIEKGTPMLKAATGSRVQILKVGKKQTIDNIESNWVKVKFLDGAKKVTGKDISPDAVGWLFGGYLE